MVVFRKFVVLGTVVSGMSGIGIFLNINENSKEEKYQTTKSLIPVDIELNEIKEKLNNYGPRMIKHGAAFSKLNENLEINKNRFERLGWKVEIKNPDDNKWWEEKYKKISQLQISNGWEGFQDKCFESIERMEGNDSLNGVSETLVTNFSRQMTGGNLFLIYDCLEITEVNKKR